MTIALWLPIGILIGVFNGLTLRWTVNRLWPDTSLANVSLVALGFLLRLALATGLLVVVFQHGIVPGLLAFAGLWLARWVVIFVTLSPCLPVRFPRS